MPYSFLALFLLSCTISLQQLKAQGYVHESDMKTLRLRKKAFVEGRVPFNEDAMEPINEGKGQVEEQSLAKTTKN